MSCAIEAVVGVSSFFSCSFHASVLSTFTVFLRAAAHGHKWNMALFRLSDSQGKPTDI